jgi:glycosyltransferase involved in cell wall biosynthesis
MEIHQLLPGLHPGDAISNHARALKHLLRSWGHTSEIYAKDISPGVTREALPITAYRPRQDTLVIYHHSMGSEVCCRLFAETPRKRLLIYHNITPHSYLEPYNPGVAEACRQGRQALPDLARLTDVALGDSGYNCQELAEHGFREPRVLPILVDFEELDSTQPCPTVQNRFADDWTHFLFVGRLSPNKRQDDVIRVFAHYQRRIERRSRLLLIGSWRGMEGYLAELRQVARSCDVEDHVLFAGHVTFPELIACYRRADVFLCLSEHEGFCVPLLEALHFDLPVLAYDAAAVPETLADAGIVFTHKDCAVTAEMAHLLVSDQALRDRVVRRQARRLADFRPGRIAEQFQAYVEELLAA